ncbi:putative pentatricopeptide repeat-containing protein At1g13630 isoform X2 [Olea europaea var. sylvestris]|uniref:putative pentatricopeptide repeat-containing protein At1g13630 isoform X2 n=1 Tax=Olea europaea var. sylvestris TaxID=158386 RepID=UPI000C1D5433|nr:putative pentatricopeptide repeat-containing protein At1g13630 isoform X2 [Olea europaea var. sylvestris]
MMAVIAIHKSMAPLMTGGGNGSARVVQAACRIGEAIEQEARILRFIEKTKRKNAVNKSSEQPDPAVKEQERLRKKVNIFMKKQELHQVRKIVKQQDDFKPWGHDAQVKNELGVKHLRVSQFVIAHILARNQRPCALQSHLHQVLLEDGSGSAPSLCELLCNAFRGWDSNHMVWDMLAFVYSRSNMVHDALFVLAKMKDLDIQPSIMTYNSLLHNLKNTDIMWDVYTEIKACGIRPSEYTNAIILDGLCRQSLIHEAVLFLQETKEKEPQPSVVLFNTLISGFCKMGFVDIAKSFFCMMFKYGLFPDVYSYNILIHGLCMVGSIEEALDFTNDMEKHGLGPDQVTFNIIAKGFRLLGMMDDAGKVTNGMLRRGLNIDLITYTILICRHWHTGNVEEGFRLREEMLSRGLQLSSISYSVLLSSLCKNGRMDEALRFLSEMENASLIPDHVMYSIIINGLCKMGEVQKAVQLYKEMCPKKITTDYVQNRSTLSRLCEKGGVLEARSYFDKVANSNLVEDIVLYNIMINKYAKLGNIGEAIRLYKIAMLKDAGFDAYCCYLYYPHECIL